MVSIIFIPTYQSSCLDILDIKKIDHSRIINEGIDIISGKQSNNKNYNLLKLTDWFNSQPMIEFASLVETSITIKFKDGAYGVILDPRGFNGDNNYKANLGQIESNQDGKTALILNPAAYAYGNAQCRKIINILVKKGYNIKYFENQDVDLPLVRHNFTEEIIYMNTHAGYWDIDGDGNGDTVVIATGEYWTENTPDLYEFEYENQMIVRGIVGEKSFVAFTPAFIDYYYEPGNMSNSLVYMATCHATYDDSMANVFLDAGASVFVGWEGYTVFWTNSMTSVKAFRLLRLNLPIKLVCNIIRYGGLYNFLFRSKLIYFGDGNYKIS